MSLRIFLIFNILTWDSKFSSWIQIHLVHCTIYNRTFGILSKHKATQILQFAMFLTRSDCISFEKTLNICMNTSQMLHEIKKILLSLNVLSFFKMKLFAAYINHLGALTSGAESQKAWSNETDICWIVNTSKWLIAIFSTIVFIKCFVKAQISR